jgi:hypothetical protein
MIVAGASLAFAASHRYEASHERSERLRSWTGARPVERPETPPSPLASLRDAVAQLQRGSVAAVSDYQSGRLATQARQHQARHLAGDAGEGLDPEQRKLVLLLEKLFGIKGIQQFSLDLDHSSVQEVQAVAQQAAALQSGGPVGWGLEYDYHEAYREYEATSLAMAGTFTTSDGRAFSFQLDYRMEREYTRTTDISIRAGDAALKDPLILDLGGGGFAAGSSAFDLDGDGGADALRHLAGGSRYLAADLDRNGRVDHGRELFGPRSGDGFADLGAHDDDGNGFIDQGDAIWDLLRLWTGDDAEPALLAQWRIAAIGLQAIEAPFSYKDGDNQLIGENRRAGVYLTDDGQAGVVKQVDLVA